MSAPRAIAARTMSSTSMSPRSRKCGVTTSRSTAPACSARCTAGTPLAPRPPSHERSRIRSTSSCPCRERISLAACFAASAISVSCALWSSVDETITRDVCVLGMTSPAWRAHSRVPPMRIHPSSPAASTSFAARAVASRWKFAAFLFCNASVSRVPRGPGCDGPPFDGGLSCAPGSLESGATSAISGSSRSSPSA